MNKQQLIEKVAERAECSKAEATKFVNVVLCEIADNLTAGDGKLQIPDFGSFTVKHYAKRQGINPQTKEKITIEARDKVVFKASGNLDIYSRKHSSDK